MTFSTKFKRKTPPRKRAETISAYLTSLFSIILMVFDFIDDVGSTVFFIRQFGRSHNKAGSKVIQDLIVFASNRVGTICTLANCTRNRATFNEVQSMRSELFKRGNFSGQIFVGCTINKQIYSNTSEKTNCQEDYVFKAIINVTSVIKCCYSHFIYDQTGSSEKR